MTPLFCQALSLYLIVAVSMGEPMQVQNENIADPAADVMGNAVFGQNAEDDAPDNYPDENPVDSPPDSPPGPPRHSPSPDPEPPEPQSVNFDFPDTLEGFGYHFKEKKLVAIETGKSFTFNVESDVTYNQRRYEALGEVITEHVYGLLESETKLKSVEIPKDASEDEPRGFFFMTEDALTNPDKIVVLIHGSGVVRAGQWARRLIINECLDSGTQLPFIEKAVADGYGVIVLNTNDNTRSMDGIKKPIRGSAYPEEHAVYVWDHFISKAAAKHVAIIAHSFGGVVTLDMCLSRPEIIKDDKVFAIAFTDSVHSFYHQDVSQETVEFFKKVARNWMSSDDPLDTELSSFQREDIELVSAGTEKHEETSWKSFGSIFKFLGEKLQESIADTDAGMAVDDVADTDAGMAVDDVADTDAGMAVDEPKTDQQNSDPIIESKKRGQGDEIPEKKESKEEL